MPTLEEVNEAAEGTSGKPRQLYRKHLHQKNNKPWFDHRSVMANAQGVPDYVIFNAGNGMREEPEQWTRKESNGNGDYWFQKE